MGQDEGERQDENMMATYHHLLLLYADDFYDSAWL
jgi:hypothetical protein